MDKNILLKTAIGELGKEEIPKGSNWGINCQKYLHSVGIDFPASWCMALVYWCVEQVCPINPLVKTGGVLRQWNEIDPKYKFKTPQPGDIFIMDFGQGHGHTGFVESINGQILNTIEGNATPLTGSREGYEICRKSTRKISDMKGFIRI